MKRNIYPNVNTETANLVISLTLMAYMHKMLKKTSVSRIKNIFYNYAYSQHAFIFDGIQMQVSLYATPHFRTYGILTVMTFVVK